MAQLSSFFDAHLVNGVPDRQYDATAWADYFKGIIGNGVSSIENSLQVNAGSGLQVIVNPGIAYINGYYYNNTTPLNLTINTANATYPRITIVVIELNLNTREIICKTIDGPAQSNPVAPAVIQTESTYQLQLATVYVPAGATSVGTVTDTRGNSTVCGMLSVLVPTVRPTNIPLNQGVNIVNQGNDIVTIESNKISPYVPVVFSMGTGIEILNEAGNEALTLTCNNNNITLQDVIDNIALITTSTTSLWDWTWAINNAFNGDTQFNANVTFSQYPTVNGTNAIQEAVEAVQNNKVTINGQTIVEKDSNGLIKQHGFYPISSISQESWMEVYLPVSYSNENYNIIVTPQISGMNGPPQMSNCTYVSNVISNYVFTVSATQNMTGFWYTTIGK